MFCAQSTQDSLSPSKTKTLPGLGAVKETLERNQNAEGLKSEYSEGVWRCWREHLEDLRQSTPPIPAPGRRQEDLGVKVILIVSYKASSRRDENLDLKKWRVINKLEKKNPHDQLIRC